MKRIISLLMVIVLIVGCCVGCNDDNNNTNVNETIVYVSKTGKIHKISYCSGMKYYTEMEYDEAVDKGYVFCKNCY